MNIAVLFGEVGFISRYKIIEGIRACASKDKANIVLFTCEGFLYRDLESYIAGEYNIFTLPELEGYDGVIVDPDSIQDLDTADYVIKKIEKAGIPCVSFNRSIPGADVIRFENEIGFREMLEQLINVHHVQDVVYVSGPKGNHDADQRKAVFLSVLHAHGIETSEHCIYYGDFNYDSGRQIAREYLASGRPLPQAFVAANDYMAIGLMDELRRAGIEVPADVLVTGYDNCDLADLTIPRLTTVDRGEYKAGCLAYNRLKEKITDKTAVSEYVVEGNPILANSCGCPRESGHSLNSGTYVDMRINMDGSLDLLKGLSIEFSNMDTLAEFEQSMEKYISKMGMEFFYFCQCGSRESYYNDLEIWASGQVVERDITKFQPTAWCPIAYEDGVWNSYSSFDIRQLFPPDCRYKKENSYYIVMPVHQGNVCIGYSIIGNFREDFSGRVIQHLVLNIDQAIGNIRKQDVMKTMLAKINQKWQFDDLTGLYNRSGMRQQAERMIRHAAEKQHGIAVLFFDLDGLKRIDDTEGHEAGDRYIRSMGDLLKAACSGEDIAVRYGGDEYILLSLHPSDEAGQRKAEQVKVCLEGAVSTSAGYAFGFVQKVSDLKPLIEQADKEMYVDKKKRHAMRKQG